MELKYSVYIHIVPNGKVYVGQSKNPEKRWKMGYSTNKAFYSDIKKYGWDNIQHLILKDNLSKSEANEIEHNMIIKYQSYNPIFGYNKTFGKTKDGKNWYSDLENTIRTNRKNNGKRNMEGHRRI